MAKRIHFLGIGGVGMAALAFLKHEEGCEVDGCDKYASPRTAWLERMGIPVKVGHDKSHLAGVDEVVATPAVHPDNPEFAAAPHLSYRGEMLAEIVSSRESIAVSGSHGKTTTSTYIARLLIALGEDVEWAIGGETGAFPVAGVHRAIEKSINRKIEKFSPSQIVSSASIEKSINRKIEKFPPVLVVEADESDGTLALYHATTLVVTNCEYDHPDHFKTEADYIACFETAKTQAKDVIEGDRLHPLAELEAAEWYAGLAPHNRRNARTAAEVALRRGHGIGAIVEALGAIVGELPDRRFQTVVPGVITDYAHHPTEMKCAVGMAREVCTGKLRVVFQPHRYSRTKALLKNFPAAFAGADEVILCPTYAAFEHPVEGGDIADLYAECRRSPAFEKIRLYLARDCGEAWEHARNSRKTGDFTLLLGAGDIISLVPRIQREAEGAAIGKRRILIGAGTNTWRSDLMNDEVYVKSETPAGQSGSTLGIAWMAGIPGTIGGWTKMNAGAFGHSFSEVLRRVKVDGRWIAAEDCRFGYRTSAIEGEIEDVELKPREEWGEEARRESSEFLSRRKRFPAGTKGSVFKNPSGDFAGRILESVGAKGLSVGGAYVWSEHANVIVAGPGATASDFLALASLLRLRVLYRLGIALEYEVKGLKG